MHMREMGFFMGNRCFPLLPLPPLFLFLTYPILRHITLHRKLRCSVSAVCSCCAPGTILTNLWVLVICKFSRRFAVPSWMPFGFIWFFFFHINANYVDKHAINDMHIIADICASLRCFSNCFFAFTTWLFQTPSYNQLLLTSIFNSKIFTSKKY